MVAGGHAGLREDAVAGAASGAQGPIGDDNRLAFERLLVDLLVTFGGVAPGEIVGAIERSLARLTAFLGFDRAAYAEFLPDGSIGILCSTAHPGLEAVPVGPFPLVLPWWRGELEAGRIVARSNQPFDLPPEAVAEAAYVTAVGMKAHLGIPIVVNGRAVAMVGFDAHAAGRTWPDDLVVRLKLVGEMFAQALTNPRATLDVVAGFRYLRLDATSDWQLSATVTGPAGSGTFPASGSIERSNKLWTAIVGVKGRAAFDGTPWFVRYYADVGAGSSATTWQLAGGVGYAFKWGEVVADYRRLHYRTGGSRLIDTLDAGGFSLGARIPF